MNNKQNKRSLIAFKCGLGAFLIYGVCLLLVVLFSTKVIPDPDESMIGQILYFSGIALICISFILSCIAIIYSALRINTSEGVDKYFTKLGLSYGFFTALIWSFLGMSFVMYLFIIWGPSRSILNEKIFFFITLAILSLAPLVLHIRFRTKIVTERKSYS